MKRYVPLFESKADIIRHALFVAKNSPSVNRKASLFMRLLLDKSFDKEEILNLAVKKYKLNRDMAEKIYAHIEAI